MTAKTRILPQLTVQRAPVSRLGQAWMRAQARMHYRPQRLPVQQCPILIHRFLSHRPLRPHWIRPAWHCRTRPCTTPRRRTETRER